VSIAVQPALSWSPLRLPLGARLGIIALVLALETLGMSVLIQATQAYSLSPAATLIHSLQHYFFRFCISYLVVCVLLFSLGRQERLLSLGARDASAPASGKFFIVHAGALACLAVLSARLYRDISQNEFLVIAGLWHCCALVAVLSLTVAMGPARVWYSVLRRHRGLLGFAAGPALLVVLGIQASQSLWHPAAHVTFLLVESFLKLFYPVVYVDVSTLTLGGRHFAIQVADQCSGLEGIGLMLIFCVSWLWYFRREYFMPRALLIIPGAVCLIFLLNSVRIALLLMIGDAGYPAVASFGFHSQAGWIAFNTAAFAVAFVARRSTWLNRAAHNRRAAGEDRLVRTENPTAPYLVPLLALLAAGMLSHALSAGFELLYPLRLVAAAIALWAYRRHYRGLGWSFSWRAVVAGAAISGLWIGVDHWLNPGQPMPGALEALSAPERNLWILCRIVAATLTVPLVEELAYRGFLMRRFTAAEFETVSFKAVRWPALVGASLIFGISHGAMWAPGVIAGLVFGYLAIRTGKIGEAVAAHATANVGLAAYVLLFDQWQMW